ncbi:MAG: hypothetical protein ACI8PB_001787 [Desulforhopalus sp.]
MIPAKDSPRAPAIPAGSSRSGVIPEPTVIVRMGEAKTVSCLVVLMYLYRFMCHGGTGLYLLYALILVNINSDLFGVGEIP